MPLYPSKQESNKRHEVCKKLLKAIEMGQTILLPEFNPNLDRPSDTVALVSVGIEPNDFGGTVEKYRYQFEGEEDLLHLIITGTESQSLSNEEAQVVCEFLWTGVPTSLMWYKPGEFSHHFYLGHDVLLEYKDSILP